MANLTSVRLNRGDASSWGFRLQGGKDFGTPLVVQKVIGGSPAERAGLIAGDTVVKINNVDVYNLRHKDAQDVILRAGPSFDIAIQRGSSTWKPLVTPVGTVPAPRPSAAISNLSPITSTSLAAEKQDSIDAIGTKHNVSAKPFSVGQVNGGPRLVNKQYNSPLPIYSDQSIAETLSAQSELLSNGVLGVNFKKNEKSYDSANSAVFRMVQEADKEPRDYEAEQDTSDSGVITTPLDMFGLRHVQAPENKPAPTTPQLPPGQNICADCERLIVGVFVRIKDKNLHVECFKCATCGTSLKNVGYYNLNNKLYCDVHAKLAARNHQPAPNLYPVTVAPEARVPAGAISAALASHSLPSPAPLSPNVNYSATPYQPGAPILSSPRPFSSVSAPQPSFSTFPKTPSAPTSQLGGHYSLVKPGPPPRGSKHFCDQNLSELEDMSYTMENNSCNVSSCLTECSTIEKKTIFDCSESISDTIDTQMLVESIVQSASQSSPSKTNYPGPCKQNYRPAADVDVTFTISEAKLKQGAYVTTSPNSTACSTTQSKDFKGCSLIEQRQPQNLASMYEKKIKVENSAPRKWESPMVVALTVAPEKSYCPTDSDLAYAEINTSSDSFSHIPAKRSTSALASALVTAPSEPFTPVTSLSLQPVPLPEETVPYFPPEHPILPESSLQNDTNLNDDHLPTSTKTYTKKKVKQEDKLFKDLPKPISEKISMLAALTTAPERSYSPFLSSTKTNCSEKLAEQFSIMETSASQLTNQSSLNQLKKKETNKDLKLTSNLSLSTNKINTTESKPVPKPYLPLKRDTLYKTETYGSKQCKFGEASTTEVMNSKSNETLESYCSEKLSKCETLTKDCQSAENVAKFSSGLPPLIQMVRSSFETKTDKVQMEMSCQFVGEPIIRKEITKKCLSKTDRLEDKEYCQLSHNETEASRSQQDLKAISTKKMSSASVVEEANSNLTNISESVLLQKALAQNKFNLKRTPDHQRQQEIVSNAKDIPLLSQVENDSHYKANLEATSSINSTFSASAATQEVSSTDIQQSKLMQKTLAMNTRYNDNQKTKSDKQQTVKSILNFDDVQKREHSEILQQEHKQQIILPIPTKEPITVFHPKQTNLNVPEISFIPVSENPAHNLASSRPRPITPSMINKPAPVIPQYQANLVAVQCAPAGINIFDPVSPAISRSPSPYVGRSASPCSFAAGPPPNPLESQYSTSMFVQDEKIDKSKINLQNHLQNQSNLGNPNLTNCQKEKSSNTAQQSRASNIIVQKAVMKSMSTKQQESENILNLDNKSIQNVSDSCFEEHKTKTINEEFYCAQKSMSSTIEKHSTGIDSQVSHKTNFAVAGNKSAGFHITNPQPIKHSFVAAENLSLTKSDILNVQNKKTLQTDANKKSVLLSAKPKVTTLSAVSSACSTAISGFQIDTLKPNISHPNAGSGGGRQAGAIGVAPKRGRGVLNLAATPGSRVPLCGQCHSNIRGPFITALGKIWCPDHFICATPSCRRALHDLGFVEEHGQLYCEYCFEQYLAPPCSKCNSKVKGDCLKAIGKNFHPECFNCVYCGKLFGNSPFFLEDAQPYCEADWNELFTTKCFACGFPVEAGDRWVEALNNNYHSQCFNCTMCKKNLEGQSFFAKGGRPFCKNHAR